MEEPHGDCIPHTSKVKSAGMSYYEKTEADGYTYSTEVALVLELSFICLLQACIRACYQDRVKNTCQCYDPRYAYPAGETICSLADRNCMLGRPYLWSASQTYRH